MEIKGIYGENICELLFQTCEIILKRNIVSEYEDGDNCDALMTLGFVITVYTDRDVSALIDKVLELSIFAQQQKKNGTIENSVLHNVGACLYNNPIKTLEKLNQLGVLSEFFTNWENQHARAITYRIRKMSFLGMLSLLSLNKSQMEKLPLDPFQLYQMMISDLSILVKEQIAILDGEKDQPEFVDDFGIADFEMTNAQLDEHIKRTNEEIEAIGEGERPAFDGEAYELLSTIDQKLFYDPLDRVNEVLLFETTLKNLGNINPELQQSLEAKTGPELVQMVKENLDLIKQRLGK